MNEVIHLSITALIASAGMVLIAAFVSIFLKLRLEKDMLVAVVRAFVQLILVGYILDLIFSLDRWFLVSAWLFLMMATASYNAMRRQTKRMSGLTARFFLAISISSLVSILFGVVVIVRPSPFWNPQYLIPIGGMIIGNAMTSSALSINRLFSEMKTRSGEIEAGLSLGSDVHTATLPAVRAAVKAGMLQVISTTMVVGLVHLPGMMTGQIIGGVEPSTAVRYQLIIMYILIATNALSALFSVILVRRLYFNERMHLIQPE
ncbi:MAG TPA: iron export ABC transporter permease subunit FetB [candidate division Zixibacteria bacterium]|nr:iron export ABC transporter permease subunit FetB [candidate division Zixibacteria bacterium]